MRAAAPALGIVTPIPIQFQDQILSPSLPLFAARFPRYLSTLRLPSDRLVPILNTIMFPSSLGGSVRHRLRATLTASPGQNGPRPPEVHQKLFFKVTHFCASSAFIFHVNEKLEKAP